MEPADHKTDREPAFNPDDVLLGARKLRRPCSERGPHRARCHPVGVERGIAVGSARYAERQVIFDDRSNRLPPGTMSLVEAYTWMI